MHACTHSTGKHAHNLSSIQTLISRLNEVGSSWNLVWISRIIMDAQKREQILHFLNRNNRYNKEWKFSFVLFCAFCAFCMVLFSLFCVHLFMRCECMHAHAHPQTLLISSGDQSWNMLKVSWHSDLIWLRYESLYTAPSCVHVFTCCACIHAHAHPQTLIISSGDQFWNMLKVLWSSDLILLRYASLYCAPSCVHVFTRCACMHAHAHPQTLLIRPEDQSWNMLKVSWSSDLIWLRYMLLHFGGNSCNEIGQR